MSSRWHMTMAVILLIQGVLFHVTASRDVSPYVPRYFDQSVMLRDSYQAYLQVRANGFVNGLLDTIRQPRAQSWAVFPEAATLFLLLGPGRQTAIDLNILYYLVFVAVTCELVRRRLGAPSGLLALGLLSSVATLTLPAGGIFDFRLDFIATTLWGMLLAVTVLADRCQRRSYILAVTLIGLLTIISRLITITYVLPVFGLLGVGSMLGVGPRALRTMRAPLMAILACWGVCVVALVLVNWQQIDAYYIRAVVTSQERQIRAVEFGVVSLADRLSFYPVSVVRDHLGFAFVVVAGLGIIAALALRATVAWTQPRNSQPLTDERMSSGSFDLSWACAVLVLAIVVPYLVLTGIENKSPVVGDIFVPPLVLLIIVIAATLSSAAARPARVLARRAYALVATGMAVIGCVCLADRLSRPAYSPLTQEDMAAASRLVRDVTQYLQDTGQSRAVWSTDVHLDFDNFEAAKAFAFEQHGAWLELMPGLGQGTVDQQPSAEAIVSQAAASDVLILTRSLDGQPPFYPPDIKAREVEPSLFELAQRKFLLYRHEQTQGFDVFAFVRPSVLVRGVSGEWITSRGLDVIVPAEISDRVGVIALGGAWSPSLLPRTLDVTGTLSTSDGSAVQVPAQLTTSETTYRIEVDLSKTVVPPSQGVTIHLAFSAFFVPIDLGLNDDPRQLVVMAPSQVNVFLRASAISKIDAANLDSQPQ